MTKYRVEAACDTILAGVSAVLNWCLCGVHLQQTCGRSMESKQQMTLHSQQALSEPGQGGLLPLAKPPQDADKSVGMLHKVGKGSWQHCPACGMLGGKEEQEDISKMPSLPLSLPNAMLLDRRQALLCAALCAPAAWCLLAWATRRPRRRDTGFEAFLKAGGDAGAQRSAADFGSFLRKAAPAQNAANAQAEPAAVEEAGPRPGDAAVAVLYGTEYGASKEVAEGLCQRLRAAGAYWWAC